MKALVQGTRVCQIVRDGEEFPVHHELKWVDCDDGVKEEDIYENEAFSKRPEPALSPAEKAAQLLPSYEQQLETICLALAQLDPMGSSLSQDAKDLIQKHKDVVAAR